MPDEVDAQASDDDLEDISGSLSAGEMDEDEEEEPCSNFSENDAIESDEEFEMAIEAGQEKRAGFEELIGYTQEDEFFMANGRKPELSP